jgi:hypothetical protein
MECHQFGLFATSTAQSNDSSATEGAIHGVPSIEKITFYLVRLDDGAILDEKAFRNDFINLAHSIGAYLYEDLLCIVSLRYQTIHVLQIRDSGNLVEVRKIGAFCQEDDELFLHSHGQVPTDPYGKIAGSIFSLHHSWYWSCITCLIKLVLIALEPWAFIVQIIVTRKKHALRCV